MAKKAKAKARSSAKKKTAKKKSAPKKKAVQKPVRKKAAKKKAGKKKAVAKKKAAKKPAKKKAAKKPAKKKTPAKAKAAPRSVAAVQPPVVEPGPQPVGIPSVEEPAEHDQAVGTVTHYYSHLEVAVVQLNTGTLSVGDTIRIKGHTTDFTQQVDSMEYEHGHIDQASAGQSFGLRVKEHAREHDIVYLVK